MIYIKDLEQVARIIADTDYNGIKIFSASIEISDCDWHQFVDAIHRHFQASIKYVKEHRNYESGELDHSHYKIKIGQVTIKAYRQIIVDYIPRIKGTDRY